MLDLTDIRGDGKLGIKRSLCFFIVIILSISFLFAEETVSLSWSHGDDSVSLYRWRRGEEEWNVTEDTKASTYYRQGETEVYHIEASYDGNSWSEDHPVIITDKERIDVLWSWKSGSEGVNYYRYRLNGGDWVLINAPQRDSGIIGIEVGCTYLIEIQASFDGNAWSESAESILTTVKVEERKHFFSFEASTSLSLSFAQYDFYNGHGIADARYLTNTNPGLTADAEIDISFGSHFRIFTGYSYSRENKKGTVIPDAFVVEHHQIMTGFDVIFPINETWRPYMGLNYVYSFDVNAGYWSPSQFIGVRIGLDYFINKNVYVGIKASMRQAHNDDSDPLYRSYTYLYDPIGIRMGVKF